jgi:hypothetical protein
MHPSAEQESTLKMIADHMDGGFLENIVDMFKSDDSYYPFIGFLLGDERGMVRIGTVALVETLKDEYADNVLKAVPGIAELLRNANAVIRGDAAYLLGIIGHTDALPFLEGAKDDENKLVRETIEESIEDIKIRQRTTS